VELASKYSVYIIEDDYMADFVEGNATPLHYYDMDGRVIYVKSFSSILFSALKIGIVVLPKELVEPFAMRKLWMDYDSNVMMQKTFTLFIENGMFLKHRKEMVENYIEKKELKKIARFSQFAIAASKEALEDAKLEITDENADRIGVIIGSGIGGLDVIEQEDTEDFHRMAGISPVEETYLKTSAFTMARQRIMWLVVLMISATFTGRIIKSYEDVLQSVVVLASFIPMLMDTGGNAGAQSSTTVIRALSLGDVEIKDIFKILKKEFLTSFIVAVVLAAINYLRLITLTKTSLDVALVVSGTLILVVIISKVIGAFLPIVAKTFKMDPAIMAGPLITTILDALTLSIYFKFATIFLSGMIK